MFIYKRFMTKAIQQGYGLESRHMKSITALDQLRFYKLIIDSMPVSIITVDFDLKITGFNQWAKEITGYSEKEAMGHYCGEILQGGMCKVQCPLKTVISQQNPIVRLDTTIQNKGGKTIPVRMNTAALVNDDGKLLGGVEAFQDISYLKALERERDSFIAMIAHDMKSSLSVIGGFALRLLKKSARIDEAKRKRHIGIIRSESVKLETMINDFLEFSPLQMGKLRLDFSPTSLDKELIELLESYQLTAPKSGLQIELQNDEALPIIEADALRLRRVFTNLLDNALKFSKQGGQITITTRETEQNVSISFLDQGIGINPEDLPYIFDPFHRGKIGEKVEGFGLGLAAVKAIVKGHGGDVQVESDVDRGSVFTVVLPKVRKGKE